MIEPQLAAKTSAHLQDRLRFLMIDQQSRELLVGAKSFLDKILPEAVDQFYAHLRTWPNLAGMFSNSGHMKMARDAQLQHWQSLFSGKFDQAYLDSVRRIGQTHSRIGLEPRWYIGGYAVTLGQVFQACIEHRLTRFSSAQARRQAGALLRALNQAVMLDMDLAISVYLEENERKHQAELGGLADGFQRSIYNVVEQVAGATTNLQGSATRMRTSAEDAAQRSADVSAAAQRAKSPADATVFIRLTGSVHAEFDDAGIKRTVDLDRVEVVVLVVPGALVGVPDRQVADDDVVDA